MQYSWKNLQSCGALALEAWVGVSPNTLRRMAVSIVGPPLEAYLELIYASNKKHRRNFYLAGFWCGVDTSDILISIEFVVFYPYK